MPGAPPPGEYRGSGQARKACRPTDPDGETLMSRRIAVSVAAGVVVLGGAGATAYAYSGDQAPALAHSTARYTAPAGQSDGSLRFTTDVTASSGVRNVKVLAWPVNSSLGEQKPTAKEMTATE